MRRRGGRGGHLPGADRAGAADLGQLATDVGSVPNQIGAVVTLEAADEADVASLHTVIGDRLAGVPRLRQRLVTRRPGGRGPAWIDDPDFDLARHLEVVDCPGPGDRSALLALAADRVTSALPATAPRWRATLVTGLDGGGVGLVVVFHHVMVDGLGGLALLTQLVDGVGDAPAGPGEPGVPVGPGEPGVRVGPADPGDPVGDPASPQRRPQGRRARPAAVLRHHVLGLAGRLRAAVTVSGHRPTVAARCSLNRPTGPRRELAVVRAELAQLRRFAHAHDGATVNDVLLGAVTGALSTLLDHRGEHLDQLVVTMMVAPPAGVPAAPGRRNQAAVAPLTLPIGGPLAARLPAIASATRARKQRRRGASAAPLGAVLRLLAGLHLLRWWIDHQRMVHVFVTNLRGPAEPVTIAGLPVTGLVPISLATGNVTVAFAAMSYAGTMTVTIVTDPTHHPDRDVLVRALETELTLAPPQA